MTSREFITKKLDAIFSALKAENIEVLGMNESESTWSFYIILEFQGHSCQFRFSDHPTIFQQRQTGADISLFTPPKRVVERVKKELKKDRELVDLARRFGFMSPVGQRGKKE